MSKNESVGLRQRIKTIWDRHKSAIIAGTVSAVTTTGAIILAGKCQRQRGEIENLKLILSSKDKIIERQAYSLGKLNQKLYGS